MTILDNGHKYLLTTIEGQSQELVFYKSEKVHIMGYDGVISQEVLRALIDRQHFMNNMLSCEENKQIIFHLRMALAEFERRHLRRLVEKNYPIEDIQTIQNAHLVPKG